jgi:DNA polymerase
VFGEGDARASLVFIGHAPGPEEERQGRPFADAAGQLLTDIIVKGMRLKRENVYICTLLKCRPPQDGQVDAAGTEACEQMLVRQLEAIKPRIIVTLGNAASQGLLRTKEPIEALRGRWQQYHGIHLMATYDPAHLLKNPGDKKAVWDDIKMVMAKLENRKKG